VVALGNTLDLRLVLESAGAFVHNPRYGIQFLYDTLEDLASVVTVDMSNLIRPE
jgi:hypothetical protein